MKFVKSINVYESGIMDRLIDGSLKIQRGQWVRCGSNKPSRFMRVTVGSSIWLVHYSPTQADRFAEICKIVNKKTQRN